MQRSVLDQVRSLVERLKPEAICDECITAKFKLTFKQHVNQKTRELAGSGGCERQIGECALCGATKKVIRQKGR
jgi:hypothetical protein